MTTILDKFVSAKNSVKELSQGTQDFISYIVDLGGIGNRDIGNIVELFDDVDESVIESAKSLKEGTITLDQFKSIAESTSSSTTKLSSSLKSVAANMAIMIAISLAIKGITYLWDKLNVTVAETQNFSYRGV